MGGAGQGTNGFGHPRLRRSLFAAGRSAPLRLQAPGAAGGPGPGAGRHEGGAPGGHRAADPGILPSRKASSAVLTALAGSRPGLRKRRGPGTGNSPHRLWSISRPTRGVPIRSLASLASPSHAEGRHRKSYRAVPPLPLIRVGTSGYHYGHWRGVFYPEALSAADGFRHCAGAFDTVEIDHTFHRLPGAETFDAWRRLPATSGGRWRSGTRAGCARTCTPSSAATSRPAARREVTMPELPYVQV